MQINIYNQWMIQFKSYKLQSLARKLTSAFDIIHLFTKLNIYIKKQLEKGQLYSHFVLEIDAPRGL